MKKVIADTRNQVDDFVIDVIKKYGYEVERKKLEFGDFAFEDNINCAVDIKSANGGIMEIAKNILSDDHNRLKREIKKCADVGGEICFLIANDENITKVEDLADWQPPTFEHNIYGYVYNYGDEWLNKKEMLKLVKPKKLKIYPKKKVLFHKKGEQMTKIKGISLMRAIQTMNKPNIYGDNLTVQFSFCSKAEAGRRVLTILEWWKLKRDKN